MVFKKFPILLNHKRWSNEEGENLAKGIKQQLQELLFQKSVDLVSDVERSSGDSNDFDSRIASIRDLDITPENIRSFLPKVNWERLASMYVAGRSGAECEARWLNCVDPLIDPPKWSRREDKELLRIIQERGISDWIDIAVLLGTNRTPFQCLARYQRSLNASILKREWTEDDDDKLRAAVETFGEGNWQLIASTLERRTGTQCSNRWIKSLHPARQRVGRWTLEEDKRLKVAVMLFGPKNWNKIAQFVPGRTHVQCRERWFNNLNPSLIFGGWTQEEDSKLDAAVAEHRNCWSKVAAFVPPRTDNQCKRRWKKMHPVEWSELKAEREVQKKAFISNFVDRESARPSLRPNDFIPRAITNAVEESKDVNPSGKQKRKSRSKRSTKEAQSCSGEVPLLTSCNGIENCGGDDSISKKRMMKPRQSQKKISLDPTQDCARNCQVGPSDCKRSRTTKKSISNHISEVEDGDDMTLALFIENKRKKIRLELAETGRLELAETGDFVFGGKSPSHESSKDPLCYHHEAPSLELIQDCARNCQLGPSDCKRSRTTKKFISNHISEVEDGDDMTLALCNHHEAPSPPPPGFENPIYGRDAS